MDGLGGLPGDFKDLVDRLKGSSGSSMYTAFPWLTAVQAGLKFGTWRSALEKAISQTYPKFEDSC